MCLCIVRKSLSIKHPATLAPSIAQDSHLCSRREEYDSQGSVEASSLSHKKLVRPKVTTDYKIVFLPKFPLNPNINCERLRRQSFGEVISDLIKKVPESSLPPFIMQGHSEKMGPYDTGSHQTPNVPSQSLEPLEINFYCM